MKKFRKNGQLKLKTKLFRTACDLFAACRLDDEGTLATIALEYSKTGVLLDPHSAVGVNAARQFGGKAAKGAPVVALATAHPAKFLEAVETATGTRPQVPAALAGLAELPERFEVLPVDPDAIAGYMRDHAAIMSGDAKGSAGEESGEHRKASP
jgi:threonine synthase